MANSPGAVVDFTSWYAALASAIPWLFAGPNGLAEGRALGQFADAQRLYLKQGIQQRFPDYASTDALPYLGGDRKLIQGPSESNANFQIRLKTAWGNSPITVSAPGLPAAQPGGVVEGWALAGTWLELLVQLYWAGFSGAVIVQQNGLAYNLSGAPTAGADPTGLLVKTDCATLACAITSSVTTSRVIPQGSPWWYFAEDRSVNARPADTDMCSRFAVLFPGPSLPSAFRTIATATFTATDNATVTWPNSFVDTTYLIDVGPPTITDGGGPVFLTADTTTKTTTGVTIRASAPFTGTATVLAWQVGANPLADLHPADLARLQQIIKTWRSNALCVGVYAVAQGKFMGWPVQAQSANTMGSYSIARFEGA
jgi:hypothetical protein